MTKFSKILILGIVLLFIAGYLLVVVYDVVSLDFLNPVEREMKEQMKNRAELFENCAQDIPREKIDDTVLDPMNKIVTVWWWDDKLQDNVSLELPYEPETGFAGCSESIKNLLQHIQET